MKTRTQTEASFQAQVVQLATLNGWHVYHTHDSRRSAAGYPDIHAWGHGRSFLAELKSEKGHLSLDQRRVIAQMRNAGISVFVWRPSDWDQIVATLTRPKAAK